jgi:hypothetical protein
MKYVLNISCLSEIEAGVKDLVYRKLIKAKGVNQSTSIRNLNHQLNGGQVEDLYYAMIVPGQPYYQLYLARQEEEVPQEQGYFASSFEWLKRSVGLSPTSTS